MPLPPGVLPVTPETIKLVTGEDTGGATVQDIDTQTGAPLSTRFVAGKQFDDAGVARYLVATYGNGNVLPVIGQDGQPEGLYFRENEQSQWKEYDPKPTGPMSFLRDLPGDIADASGDIIEAGAQQLGTQVGARIGRAAGPLGAVAGGLLGGWFLGGLANAERQAEVAALPGAEPRPAIDRATQAVSAGNLAVVGEGVGSAIGSAGRQVAKQVRKVVQPRYRNAVNLLEDRIPRGKYEALSGTGATGADEAASGVALESRLSERMGEPVEMSVAQLTGSRKAAGFENIIRTALPTAEASYAIDVDAARQVGRGMDKLIDRVSKGEVSGAQATSMLGGAYNASRNALIDAMHKQDAVNFGAVQDATKGGKLFSVRPLLDFVQQAAPSAGQGTASAAEKYAAGLVRNILEESGVSWIKAKAGEPVLTARQMQSVLRAVGKRVADGETVDMPVNIGGQKASVRLSRSETQQIARGVFRSLQESLDEAIGRVGGDASSEEARTVAVALRKARDAHRQAMEGIEASQKSFGDLAVSLVENEQGSLGPKRWLSKTPQELASLAGMLRKTPDGEQAVDKMVGASLRSIVDESLTNGPRGAVVSPEKLSSALFANKDKLSAVIGEGDKAFLADLTELAGRLRRVNVFGGASQTAPLKSAIDVTPGRAGVMQAAAGVVNAVARKVGILQSPESLLRVMNDRDQLKLMLKLVGPRAYDQPIEQTSRALSKLLGLQASRLGRDDDELKQQILEALRDDQDQPSNPLVPVLDRVSPRGAK